LNGAKPKEFKYVAEGESKTLEFEIPTRPAGLIHLRFRLPDAVSPKKLGLNDDTRKLAISIKSVEFE
jgi:hypothetical protein